MSKQFEYTTLAHRYTARFPMLTYVGIQANFWIVANILLVVLIYFQSQIIGELFKIKIANNLGSMVMIATILGVLYGVSLGIAGYQLDRSAFRKLPLGKIILFKTLGSLALLILALRLLRFPLLNLLITPSLDSQNIILNRDLWTNAFYLLLIYYFIMTLLINFINQVNKKYGPGVLLPLLFGRYRNPKEEERIFMFMDLKSSTIAAEKLGHLKYSAFIRDCFADINEVLYPFRAQVYQYVGDEIVVMWPKREGVKNHLCIMFYFACKKQFQRRSGYYTATYGLVPEFKAGLHLGIVTVVEIGEIKRDSAYHGDTLNTAARIQHLCNEYNKDFLVSEYLMETIGTNPGIKAETLGMVLLKGKTEKVGIVSVSWIDRKEVKSFAG